MKHWFVSMLFAALAVTMSAAKEPSPAAHTGQAATQPATAHSATTSQARGFFKIELTKSLDSKKLKAGDEVEAKLTSGIVTTDGVSIPSGTKVIGHITEAKARSNHDSESTLGIVFDKIVRRGGEDTPIKSVIQAAAPNPNSGANSSGGVGYSGLNEAAQKNSLPTGTNQSVPVLNEQSRGVLGIKNLQLGSEGVFISSGKEVKLDSGIQLLLDVTM
jgi:hypothetical protein